MKIDELISRATDFYLESGDFNGYPARHIHEEYGLSYEEIRKIFTEIVASGKGTVIFGDLHPNPHIRAFADEPVEKQLEKLETVNIEDSCLYPSASHLSKVVKRDDYQDRPFTLELALGAGQLEHRSFDLSVLEVYRNDPRYYYSNDDIQGHICVTDEFFESDQMLEKDQVILETFGFSYDKQMNRAVAVFLRYLNQLSPAHQQFWNSKRVSGEFELHQGYYRSSILGDWDSGISVFKAFIEELKIINHMCKAMGRPELFRDTFDRNWPRNFSFLVRPTQKEFNDFVLTLDKMMSDNINKKFFRDEIPDETEEKRGDGKVALRSKGTISMLNEWLNLKFRPKDPKLMHDMIAAFRKVRRLRQKPAHAVDADTFDQKFFHRQRELIISAYTAIRTLRLIFANHPKVISAKIEIPDFLHPEKFGSTKANKPSHLTTIPLVLYCRW